MRLGDVAFGPCHTDVEWSLYCFIASALTSDIGHPMASLEGFHLIGTTPGPVNQCWETATLVHIPATVLERQQTTCGFPCEQVVTFGKPCLIAAAVGAVFAIIYNVCHIPLAVFTEDSGAVNLVIVVGRSNHHAVFIWGAYLFIYALHHIGIDT